MGDLDQDAGNLAGVAERLRAVTHARRRFLRLWGIEQALVEPMLDRVAADVEQADHPAAEPFPSLYDDYQPPGAGSSSALGR